MANIHKILSDSGPYIAKDGSLGVGIVAPDDALLHVYDTVNRGGTGNLRLTNTSNTQTVLLLENTTSRKYELAVGGNANSIGNGSFYIYDVNAGASRFEINSSGNATFAGDVTVNGGYLTVNGSQTDEFIKVTNSNHYTGIWMNDSHTNNGWLLLSGYTDAASPGDFAIREYGVQTSLVIKQTTGNVGVGTVSPDEKLHIEKAGNTTKTRLQIQGGNKGFTLGKTQQDADYAHLKPINAGSPAVLRVMANTNDADSYIEVWHTDYEANTSNYARGMFYIDGNNNVHLRSNAAGTYTAGSVFIGAGANTSALEINNSGNATFAGDVNIDDNLLVNHDYDTDNRYLFLRKHQSNDGGIVMQSKTAGGVTQSDWQILNHGGTGDLKFYAYGLASHALTLDRENGNAFFAGKVGIGVANSDGDSSIGTPKLHVLGSEVSGKNNLVARFQGGNDSDNTYASIMLNHSNDRGLILHGGRAASNRAIGFINLIQYDGSELVDGITLYQPNSAGAGDTTGTNVGIGTTSPSAKVHVQGTNSGVLIDTSTAYTPLIKASGTLSDLKLSSVGNGGNLVLEADCTTASIIQFNNGGSERMRITSGGNLGIGTTSPDTLLHIVKDSSNSQLTLQRTGSATGKYEIYTNTNSLYIYDRGQTSLRAIIDSSGNFGLGTSTPGQKLHVEGALRVSSGGDRKIDFLRTGGNHFSIEHDTAQIYFYNHTTSESPILMQNDGDVIMNAGNVGIGGSPSHILDVVTTGSRVRFKAVTGDADIELSSIEGKDFLISSLTDGSLRFYDEDVSKKRMTITSDGTILGTGTYTASGSIKIFEAERDGGAVKSDWSYDDATTDMSLGTNTNHAFALKTNNTRRIIINNTGNVLIGGTTDKKTLTVYGGNDDGIWVDSQGAQYTSVAWGNNGTEKANIAYDNTNTNFALSAYASSSMTMATGGSVTLTLDTSSNATFAGHVHLADGKSARFGDSNDLKLYHASGHGYIENDTGALYIINNQNDGNIVFQNDDGNGGLFDYFSIDGGSTTHDGSATTAAYTKWYDKSRIALGNDKDLQIYHDGTNSFITEDNAGGSLIVRASNFALQSSDGTDDFITTVANAQVNLFYNNSKKFETTNTGVSVTGAMTASGEVTAFSDERLKSNIETLDGSKVYDMRGVSFTKDDKVGSGVIAQELEKVAPELVNNDSEYKSVAYGNITGYLIEAIKDLKAEIEELKKCECKNCNCK